MSNKTSGYFGTGLNFNFRLNLSKVRDYLYLVKICDDFVEKPKTLNTLVVEVQLDVELVEVGDAGEDDAHAGVGLAVEVL